MRVIAGQARGVPLRVPKGEVRPTSDRVREAAFSLLGELVVDARCLDLYAGSGALGIEALSRGASTCMFVDSSRAAAETIRANLLKTKLTGGSVKCETVERYLQNARAGFDLVLADPPYRKSAGVDLAAELAGSELLVGLMSPGAILVLESDRGAGNCRPHAGLEPLDHREYGGTQLAFYRRVRD